MKSSSKLTGLNHDCVVFIGKTILIDAEEMRAR